MRMIKKIIHEAECMPFWYGRIGPAPQCYHAREIAPIPINFIYRLWYWIMKHTHYTTIEKMLWNSESIGWAEGYKEGLKMSKNEKEFIEYIKNQYFNHMSDELLEIICTKLNEYNK